MPVYRWRNLKTEDELEVVRRINEYDLPPTEEETKDAKLMFDGEWIRILSGGIKVKKTNAFGHGKGYHNSQSPRKYRSSLS